MPFVDGNKRTAMAAADAVPAIFNGFRLDRRTTEDLYPVRDDASPSGEIDETGAAAFFRDHIEPIERP